MLTWTSKPASSESPCFWPAELLPSDLPSAHIIAWGYSATVFKLAELITLMSPTQIAYNLCIELRSLRDAIENRPLIFVAHSRGVIVVQKALLHSNESAGYIAWIVGSSRSVIFIGTPHCGSEKADFASFFNSIVKVFHSVNDTMIQQTCQQSIQSDTSR